MMNSLFSSFDPMSSTMGLNYSILVLFFLIPSSMVLTLLNSRITMIFLSVNSFMGSELKTSIMSPNWMGKTKILLAIFMMLLFFNLMGLIPYVYTVSAQLMFTLVLSLPFWLGFVLFSMTNNTFSFFAHLVPSGTPLALSQFMVLIESVSLAIRPITLSVRLAANMTAGHILIALSSASILMMNHMTLALMMLFLLELAVAFIQSYVFVTLLSMYLSETN